MLEREGRGRGEHFVNRNRLNIVARSVAAVGIVAAGVAAVEKTGLFDPLSYPGNSANHLVLNKLDGAYEQLIDRLPEVEKAEAAPPGPTYAIPSPNTDVTNGVCAQGSEQIDFSDNSITMHVGDRLAFGVDVCLPSGGTDSPVRLVEVDGLSDDTLGSLTVFIVNESWHIGFYLDCEDGGILPNKIVGSSGYSRGGSGHLAVELGSSANHSDNIGSTQGVASVSCEDVCPGGSGGGAGSQEGSAAGSCSVGGILEAPDLSNLPQDMNSEKNPDYATPIAAGVAGAIAAAIAATGGILYSRRNRSAK